MAITYENARDLVRSTLQPQWKLGTFCLDDRNIVENDDMYVFEVGAREFLVDGDASFSVPGGVTVVYKTDGRLDSIPSFQVATDPTIRTKSNPHPTFA
ncbi:hypothetical protein ACFYXM_11295 [Streptomyces sp. NPDC002476]|uniref:hypothetical protein n=1 Tax=Streptomyces sp. NPDC002476 TaxID=3364648 RepID=UPI0036CDC42F